MRCFGARQSAMIACSRKWRRLRRRRHFLLRLALLEPVLVQAPHLHGDRRVGRPDVLGSDDPQPLPDVVAEPGQVELGRPIQGVLFGDPDTIGERLAALLVDVLEQPALHQRLTGVIRAAASEPQIARMLREFLTRELFGPAAEMLHTDDGPLRANLVGAQIVGLIMARYVIAIEPLASTPPATVADAIAPTLQRYLFGPLTPDNP
jgi:Tetracyclin repressor-like, C-terminal domain